VTSRRVEVTSRRVEGTGRGRAGITGTVKMCHTDRLAISRSCRGYCRQGKRRSKVVLSLISQCNLTDDLSGSGETKSARDGCGRPEAARAIQGQAAAGLRFAAACSIGPRENGLLR
jgi:hypothetical protein